MPYDIYERHTVVSQLLEESIGDCQENVSILDVGGRSELLGGFLPYPTCSVNVDKSSDVVADGCALPIRDETFAAVVSIDTLEHLPRQRRSKFVQECWRVARYCAIIAAPFGSEEHEARERRIDALHRSVLGRSHLYLDEHIRYGLPGSDEIENLAQVLGNVDFTTFFAGDYTWQARQFERSIITEQKKGLLRRLWRAYNHLTSLALFHPIRLLKSPDLNTNRFYLLIQRRPC
jgi:hypothetical protein